MANEPEVLDDVTPAGELHLEEYLTAVLKRWRLIALCVGVALTVAVLYAVLSDPLYRAGVILDVEPERPGALDIGPGQPSVFLVGPDYLATQARLMQTREIAERVVRRLNLVENREFNPPENRVSKSGEKLKPGEEFSKITSIVKASLSARPVRDVGVTNRDTTLVELSAVASSPGLAARIANAAADAYLDWNQESRYGTAGRAAGYLATQIQQTKAELDAKSQQLLAYGKEKDIVGIEGDPNALSQRNEMNIDGVVADRVTREAHYRDLMNARPEIIADTLAGGLVGQLRADQEKLERDYAEKLNLFKPDWPAMRQLKAQIDSGREHLDAAIAESVAKARETAKNEYLAAARKEESLRAAMKSQRSETMRLSRDAVGYSALKLEVDSKKTLLDTLLKRQAEVEVASRLGRERESSIRVAERARPPHDPFVPSYFRSVLIGLFLGGAIGAGLALLLEYLDRSLRTPEQVEQTLQLPALGVIPAMVGDAKGIRGLRRRLGFKPKPQPMTGGRGVTIELLPHEDPRSALAEAYRTFRTALLLSRAGGVRSVVVTSSLQQEGKTTTAVNLAITLGQLGRRTLLVDADLHKSRIHEVFHVSNQVGLVSILAENAEPSRAIVKTSYPGVFVVPGGPETPNPSGLLSSESMRKFLRLAGTNFDHVIIDTPPVLLVSDALVFAHQADGVVLCVRGGVTRRDHVTRARDRILRSGASILGVLINALKPGAGGYYTPYLYEYGEKPRETEEPPVPSIVTS